MTLTIIDRPIRNTSAKATPIEGVLECLSAEQRNAVEETAIAEIVGLVVAKYADEGERNFAIGKGAYEHAQWQRGNFGDGYSGKDFDDLMNLIRERVLVVVAINPKSIQLSLWVRAYLLRQCVADAKGDDAAKRLSYFEYRTLAATAMTFDKASVSGELVPGWLDFIMDVSSARGTGNRVTSQQFADRMASHAILLAHVQNRKAEATAKPLNSSVKAKALASAKANAALTVNVSDALSLGLLPIEAVLGIVETVARTQGITLPSVGFDPARCSDSDCDLLAASMLASGKLAEMVRLRDRLNTLVPPTSNGLSARMALRTA